MGNVLDFPKKIDQNREAQVIRLQSYIKSNIVLLTDLRSKLIELQRDIKRLQRGQLKLVYDANDSKNTE